MADHKLRVKIGGDEFDAEGPKEFVEDLFRRFETLVNTKAPQLPPGRSKIEIEKPHDGVAAAESPFAKVFLLEGNRLALIGKFNGEDRELDAALLILFGHRALKGAEAVSADELLNGLKQTGYTVERADRLMKRGKDLGLVNYSGVRRGTKYRLTVPGVTKAKELWKELQDMFQLS